MELIRGAKEAGKTSQHGAQGLAGWAINLMKNRGGLRDGLERQMRLEETLSLGGKRQLLLISCGEEKFLVGGSMESVEVIVPVRNRASSEADIQCR